MQRKVGSSSFWYAAGRSLQLVVAAPWRAREERGEWLGAMQGQCPFYGRPGSLEATTRNPRRHIGTRAGLGGNEQQGTDQRSAGAFAGRSARGVRRRGDFEAAFGACVASGNESREGARGLRRRGGAGVRRRGAGARGSASAADFY
jgi:hypothetical protein